MGRARTAAGGLVLLLLAACGGGAGGGDGEGPTVVIGVHTEPEALNPYGPAGETPIVYQLLTATKVPPYVQAPDQTWAPSELLDGEAELTADPMTLTYRIHPDATWSDGVAVSARDFVFTWETITDLGLEMSGRVGVEDISDAEVVDEKTVRFTFARPYAPWRGLFSRGVLPAHVLEGEDFDAVWLDGPTVTAGPYRVVEWRKGVHLLLERNPHWWGRSPQAARLRYQMFDDPTTLVQALVGGEVDVIEPHYDGVAQLRSHGGVRLDTALAHSWVMLVFHADVPHDLRAAVAHGLDRDALADAALHEVVDEPSRLDSLVFAPRPADAPASFARYDHDPERARRLLPDGDAAPALRWLDENSGPLHTARFEVAQSQLRAAGVDLQPDLRGFGLYVEAVLGRDFDMFVVRFTGQWALGAANVLFACGSLTNFAGYCDPTVDRLLAEGLAALDPDVRVAAYLEAEDRIAEDLVVLPLYQMPHVLAWRAALDGPRLNPYGYGMAWNALDWRLEG